MGRLKMSEDLWRCLLISLVSGVVFVCLRRYCGLSWSCLGVLWGVSDGSARVGSSQAGANPPILAQL